MSQWLLTVYTDADTFDMASSSDVRVERSLAVRAISAALLQMLLPAVLKMSTTAVSSSLCDEQVSNQLAILNLTAYQQPLKL